MPTYQYRCRDCSHDLEVVQKFTDASLTECPHCRGDLRKVYNAVGVVFKGSGFYATDSRNKNTASTAPTASSSSEGSSTPATTTETSSGSPAPAAASPTAAPSSTPAKA